MYLRKAITLQANSRPPSYDLHKLSNTQFILMYHSVVKAASACILPQSSDIILQKSSDMLNKNTLGVYKKV